MDNSSDSDRPDVLASSANDAATAASTQILLDFVDTDVTDRRENAVSVLSQFDGLGAFDSPKGRREAYRKVIAPWAVGTYEVRDWLKTSSCMLVVAALWRALGCASPKLQNIPFSKVGIYLDGIARADKAARHIAPKEVPAWQPGDSIIIGASGSDAAAYGGTEHILTVVKFDGTTITSVDGGQNDPSGGPCAISRRTREVQWRGSNLWLVNPSAKAGGRRVQQWFDLDSLDLQGTIKLPVRSDRA